MQCQRIRACVLAGFVCQAAGARASGMPAQEAAERPAAASVAADILPDAATRAARNHKLAPLDDALLEEIQRACFAYFWKEVGEPSKLAKDRMKGPTSSIAAVGFQLSALPIGVERGWISRAQGHQRAETILRSLLGRQDNKRFGVYLHFPDLHTGGLSRDGYEIVASTVDHALLLAGAITAAAYFDGEVAALGERMIDGTNWKPFATGDGGTLSMGWRPADPAKLDGPGEFLKHHWWINSDEERLVYLMAQMPEDAAHRIPPETYYRLKRDIRRHDDLRPFAVSWPGTLFTYFFSHCWIDFASLGPDDPKAFGGNPPRVDWFENSRRAALTHRARCIEQMGRFKSLAENRWGLSACAARDGYIVPEIRPNVSGNENWHAGTVAPYAAGSCIMFTPTESIACLRALRELTDSAGRPLVWRDPGGGGYGFVDSFNLDQNYAHEDYVGIDQGPLLLAIENVRSGLIWKLFMGHAGVKRAMARLRWEPRGPE